MTFFEVLFLAHLIGDYLLQTTWMAVNKSKQWLPLLTHCTVYTVVLVTADYLFVPAYTLSLPAIALIFVAHVALDRRTFVVWWVRHIQRVDVPSSHWLCIMSDQIFHLLVIGVAVAWSQA